jgi:pimeloyl-ACP methyl ester carboxylesterase
MQHTATMKPATLPNGLELQYEVLGNPSRPVVMPILGITDNITDWPERFCDDLLDTGYCVVRHELRDMGLSSQCPGVEYTIADIARDVVLLMDHLKIAQADLIGYSFGGAIAQVLALDAPERARRLVLLQSSNYDPSLPARSKAVEAAMAGACEIHDDREGDIEAIRLLRLVCGGSQHVMSDREARASAERSVARAYRPEGTARLIGARVRSAPFYHRLPEIRSRALVIQATEDPIFPLGHGEDIARRVPGALLTYLRGAGHSHPDSLHAEMLRAITDFLGRANGSAN